jgi:hypothetical protein
MKLTVYHDGQYWVGVVEVTDNGKLKAGRYVFGSEPKDQEILAFIHRNMDEVTNRLSQAVDMKPSRKRRVNPKRLAGQAAREMCMNRETSPPPTIPSFFPQETDRWQQ